ncbi:hypothetical protein [Actinocorallia herbida]|uniref:hypothetical protein n=1 Tax=Actinocorallia herbida TaxID=58109 RepID=UPI00319DFE63
MRDDADGLGAEQDAQGRVVGVDGQMIIRAGVGIAYGAMPALIMSAVPRSETSAANSLNSLMRSLGTSIGAAVIGVVIAQMTITLTAGHAVMSEDGARVGLAVGLIATAIALFLPTLRRKTAAEDNPTPSRHPPHQPLRPTLDESPSAAALGAPLSMSWRVWPLPTRAPLRSHFISLRLDHC